MCGRLSQAYSWKEIVAFSQPLIVPANTPNLRALIAKLEALRAEAVADRFEAMVVLLDELVARLKALILCGRFLAFAPKPGFHRINR